MTWMAVSHVTSLRQRWMAPQRQTKVEAIFVLTDHWKAISARRNGTTSIAQAHVSVPLGGNALRKFPVLRQPRCVTTRQ